MNSLRRKKASGRNNIFPCLQGHRLLRRFLPNHLRLRHLHLPRTSWLLAVGQENYEDAPGGTIESVAKGRID